jgi:uncharacterized repeat protein (TIGR01451 family)
LFLVLALSAGVLRALAATYTVTTINDAGAGSLRQAVFDANFNPGPDTIQFNILPAGAQRITLFAEGLVVTDPVTIDGSTQPGFSGSPLIVLAGADANGPGLRLSTSNCLIRSLVISNFAGHGLELTANARNNVIGGTNAGAGNLILSNGLSGVAVLGGTNNAIRGNAIHGHGSLGIDLGNDDVTSNDANDPDGGPNELQNYPVLSAATISTNSLAVSGTLNSRPSTVFQLDFFANQVCDDSGFGEGQVYLGTRAVTNLSGGTVSFSITLPVTAPGRFITATATDPFGNTSEFSPCLRAASTLAPATLDVANTNDTGAGSLRQALLNARARPATGPNTIRFAIPGPGIRAIFPATPLPALLEAVTLDGYTQTGASQNTLSNGFNATVLIQLDGSRAGPDVFGLTLAGDGHTVRGLSVVNFAGGGIAISGGRSNTLQGNLIGLAADGTDAGNGITADKDYVGPGIQLEDASFNLIGGTSPAARNIISANGTDGIWITGEAATGNQVQGNFIGTDATGRVGLGNGEWGVNLDLASGNLVGGNAAGAGNLISWNGGGVQVLSAVSNRIQGNFIGSDITGTNALGNGAGIGLYDAAFNRIGGTNPAARNIIVANGQGGIEGIGADNNVVLGNAIGADAAGQVALGNSGFGVSILVGDDNRIGGLDTGAGNTIAFNGGNGVEILIGSRNAILGNAVFGNEALGIDLDADGLTPNDPGDDDFGANDLQNFPELTHAIVYPDRTLISGRLDSLPGTYRLEFFLSEVCDDSGYGEGQAYLTNASVTISGGGPVSFALTLPVLPAGRYLTATATDSVTNSSEFSACRRLVAYNSVDLAVTQRDSADPVGLATNLTYTITVTNYGPTNATGVVVTDTLPATVSFVSAAASQGGCAHSAGVVTCNLGTLNQGAFATINVTVRGTEPGRVQNLVAVSANQSDHTPANNSVSETTLVGVADVAVSIAATPESVRTGELLTYTVTVTNRGPDLAAAVMLTNALEELSPYFVAASVSQGTLFRSNLVFTAVLGTIAAGASATLTVSVVCTEPGFTYCFARVQARGSDPVSANNAAERETWMDFGPGILVFEASSYEVLEGGGVVFLSVVRQGGFVGTVGVSYAASNDTATAGADFGAESGTLTFGPSEFRQVIAFPIRQDLGPECNETFHVHLFDPTGGFVLAGQTTAQVTITDDDLEPAGLRAGVSVRPDNPSAAGEEASPAFALSGDGRWVAFESRASDLAPNDHNGASDLFARDLVTGTTRLVSASRLGTGSANGASRQPALAAGGRWIAYASDSSDLVTNAIPTPGNVFLHDLLSGTTTLISRSTNQSAAGANSPSQAPVLSRDGQIVAFLSAATDLATLPNPDETQQVFVRDRAAASTRLASVNRFGARAGNAPASNPRLSADGRFVAFESAASDLVANDGNNASDVFVRNLLTETTVLANVNAAGTGAGNGRSCCASLSADGRYVAFFSEATDLVPGNIQTAGQVFVRDLVAGITVLASVSLSGASGNGVSSQPALSADGRFVAFASQASDLVPGDNNGQSDVFLRDLAAGTTRLISVNCDGTAPASGPSGQPALSADGLVVAFLSRAADLAPGDFSVEGWQAYRREWIGGTTTLLSVSRNLRGGGDADCLAVALNDDGRTAVFTSLATDLLAEDWNEAEDVFAWTAPAPGATADLAITMTSAEAVMPSGQLLRFTVTVTNHGPDTATGVLLRNLVSAEVFIVAAQTSQGEVSIEDSTVLGQLGAMPAHGFATMTLTVAPAGSEPFLNAARASALEFDSNPADNFLAQTVSCASADLVLTHAVSPTPAAQSTEVTFTLAVTNQGPDRAAGIVVTDTLPGALSFVSAQASAGSCVWSGGQLTCTLGQLDPQTGASITLVARADAVGVFTNLASLASSACDPVVANNLAEAAVQVVPPSQPQLLIWNHEGTLILTWPPGTPSAYLLETTPSLVPPVTWTILSNAVSPLVLSNSAAEPSRFYRMRLP